MPSAYFENGKIRRIRKKDQNLEVARTRCGWMLVAPGSPIRRRARSRASRQTVKSARFRCQHPSSDLADWHSRRMARSGSPISSWRASRVCRTVYSLLTAWASKERRPTGSRSTGAGTFGRRCKARTSWGALPNSGELTTFDVPTRNSGLGDLAIDQSGAVWFLELRANKIGRFAEGRFAEFEVPTPSAGLASLAAAPDGSLWFTELSAGKLGRIKNGQVSEFSLPRAGSRPFGVAVDTSNVVWYTDLERVAWQAYRFPMIGAAIRINRVRTCGARRWP